MYTFLMFLNKNESTHDRYHDTKISKQTINRKKKIKAANFKVKSGSKFKKKGLNSSTGKNLSAAKLKCHLILRYIFVHGAQLQLVQRKKKGAEIEFQAKFSTWSVRQN